MIPESYERLTGHCRSTDQRPFTSNSGQDIADKFVICGIYRCTESALNGASAVTRFDSISIMLPPSASFRGEIDSSGALLSRLSFWWTGSNTSKMPFVNSTHRPYHPN